MIGGFFNTIVYAQSWIAAPTETLIDTVFNVLWSALNLLYLITLPVLVIAGKAMDNSMVYGEFINLDKPLFMLRNLSRTFANFAIWWVILRKVVKYIFNFDDNKSPEFLKGLIIKSLGIVLGINFSWFAMGALIDLSSLATYTLGAMPLSVLKETNSKDMPILSVGSYFDYQSSASRLNQGIQNIVDPYTYYQRWDIYIPRCNEKWKIYKGIITWPEYFPTVPNKTDINFNTFGDGKQYCALNTQTLVDITDLEKRKNDQTNWINNFNNTQKNSIIKSLIDEMSDKDETCSSLVVVVSWTNINFNKAQIDKLAQSLRIGDWQIEKKTYCQYQVANQITITGNAYQENNRQTTFMPWAWWQEPYSSQNGLTMNNLINESKGMVWPFITLYITLLDFSNLSIQDTKDKTAATTLNGVTEFLLKWGISIALFIPLVALAITLIIRIVLLRWIIAFIPLGIVAYGLFDKKEQSLWSGLWAANPSSILWLIFAPILPVFTISISIIILQTLQLAMKPAIDNDNKTRDFMWIEFFTDTDANQNTSCMNFWGLQTVCLDKGTEISGWSGFANFLPWLFVNIFAIGLMWMMVKVAISGSTITGKIWWNIMEMWSKALGSIPLISIWWRSVWANALSKTLGTWMSTLENKIGDINRVQDRTISDAFGLTPPEKVAPTPFSLSKKDEVSKNFRSKIWSSPQTFKEYNDTIEKSIESENEKANFAKISNSDKSWIIMNFVADIEKEKIELEKDKTKNGTKISELQTQITNLSKTALHGWYSDFINQTDNNKIEETKINDFINYLNSDNISKLLKDEATGIKNTEREKIETKFRNQIDYKDGKFQATKTK